MLAGERAAFALSRPPGHHAGADYCGGYCHLNSAAVAAQAARDAGVGRVAVLDIDYHHGNGSQDIFWARGDVFFASVHADPATDFPFYWGHADERGAGEGDGATLNLPLPRGSGLAAFGAAQAQALDAIARVRTWGCWWSASARTRGRATRSATSAWRPPTMPSWAARMAERGWPTVVLMEGGYAVDALGANVASLLSGWA